ncbi:MAG: branched-chain amino acid transport system substrate-binding protein, partial [Bradyrhizobium sp.]|nr:branched-chain amino acid transport system substrate-binding protein [Bradyrhizobium sp.]
RQPGFRDRHLFPGIRIKTSPTDFYPIEQVQMMRFTGEKWQSFGPVIDGHAE